MFAMAAQRLGRLSYGRPTSSECAAAAGIDPMRRFAMKALFSLLTLQRDDETQLRWDRIVLIGSTLVTIGLIALYAYSKAEGRW